MSTAPAPHGRGAGAVRLSAHGGTGRTVVERSFDLTQQRRGPATFTLLAPACRSGAVLHGLTS